MPALCWSVPGFKRKHVSINALTRLFRISRPCCAGARGGRAGGQWECAPVDTRRTRVQFDCKEYQTFNVLVLTFASLLRVIKCLAVMCDKMWDVVHSFCTTWHNTIAVLFQGIWACWIMTCFLSFFCKLHLPWYDWLSARIHQPAPAACLAECQTFKTAPACACLKLCSPAMCNWVPGCNVWQCVMYYIIL